MRPDQYAIKTSIVPVGGWHYPQPNPTGGEIRLAANSWEELIDAVRTFRINVNLPIGDPAAEISDYTRINSPQNDTRTNKLAPFVANKSTPITPLAERMKDWLVTLTNQQVGIEDLDEIVRRAKICAECPQNIQWETTCGDCNENIRYKGNTVRRAVQFAMDSELRGCRANSLYLPAAVFLSSGLPVKSPKSPPRCWLKS